MDVRMSKPSQLPLFKMSPSVKERRRMRYERPREQETSKREGPSLDLNTTNPERK